MYLFFRKKKEKNAKITHNTLIIKDLQILLSQTYFH